MLLYSSLHWRFINAPSNSTTSSEESVEEKQQDYHGEIDIDKTVISNA